MAEIKDTGLPAGSTPTSSDIYTGVQSGSSVRWTHGQMLAFIEANIDSIASAITFQLGATTSSVGNIAAGPLILKTTDAQQVILSTDNTTRVRVLPTTGNVVISFATDQGYKLAVNGTTANTTGVWATISDEDLKNILGPVTGNLEKVKQLKECLIHYELKEGVGSGEEGYRTGYSAHKLQKYFPGHVKEAVPTPEEGKYLGWKYETISAEYDQDGNETKPEEIKTVKEGRKKLVVENNFDVYAIGAVAELSEIVEKQQETIDALTKRFDALEGK